MVCINVKFVYQKSNCTQHYLYNRLFYIGSLFYLHSITRWACHGAPPISGNAASDQFGSMVTLATDLRQLLAKEETHVQGLFSLDCWNAIKFGGYNYCAERQLFTYYTSGLTTPLKCNIDNEVLPLVPYCWFMCVVHRATSRIPVFYYYCRQTNRQNSGIIHLLCLFSIFNFTV